MPIGMVHVIWLPPFLKNLHGNLKGTLMFITGYGSRDRPGRSFLNMEYSFFFLLVPDSGKPQLAVGALPKGTFIMAIKDVLGVEK